MIGNNKVILNKATMMVAVQEYLTQRWDEASSGEKCPVVVDIESDSSGSYTSKFTVFLKSDTAKP